MVANSSSGGGGNIFFTMENLAFSLPLIIVCSGYAYFKYVPLSIGLPILGGIFILYQIRSQIRAQRAKKITNMDDKAISDLALQLETDATSDDGEKKVKDVQKKKRQVELRLAAEKKKDEKASKSKKKGKKGGAGDDDDEDDEDALLTFAKGSRPAAKKKN